MLLISWETSSNQVHNNAKFAEEVLIIFLVGKLSLLARVISNSRPRLLLTLMQSQVMRNHACLLQLIRLYFAGVGRDTTETKKAINRSSKYFNSALLTLKESLNASLYVFI